MAEHRGRRARARRADDPAAAGRPSRRASERLETQFAAELGLTRAAWDDALQRSDERLRQGDAAAAVASLEDQRRLLVLLEDRLHAVVSSAAVEREAERIVASVPAPGEVPQAPERRPRVQVLAGAGAAVAATLVAIAMAVTLGLGTSPVPEIAAPGASGDGTAALPTAAELEHVVAAAGHVDRHGGFDVVAASTNWFQELRSFDLRVAAASPADDDHGAGDTDREVAGAAEADGPDDDRSPTHEPDAGAGEDTAARSGDDTGQPDGAAEDEPPGEPAGEEPEDDSLLDLDELRPDEIDEDTSLRSGLDDLLPELHDPGMH